MQDHVWDGIKRDRLVWIGDLHPETMVIATLFGEHPIVPASLDYVRDRTPPGLDERHLFLLPLVVFIQHDWVPLPRQPGLLE